MSWSKGFVFFLFSTQLFFSCQQNMIEETKEVAPKLVFELNFDEDTFTKEESRLITHELIEISNNEGINNSKCIEVSYVGNEQGSKRVVRELQLPSSLTEATLNFSVKFQKGFQFVKGGKLHGFGPLETITGGNTIVPKGWSARMMFKENGTVQPYIYHQGMKGQFGEGQKTAQAHFSTDRYHTVSMYMKINQPASASNGVFELWIDGTKASFMENIQFRSDEGDGTLITSMLFSTFLGGNDPSWAPKDQNGNYVTQIAWFDDFSIYQGKKLEGQ